MRFMGSKIYNLQTPCFIFDEAEFKRGVYGFRDALLKKFDQVDIGYSVKTNPLPYVIRHAGKLGCKAEVVSQDEYDWPVSAVLHQTG